MEPKIKLKYNVQKTLKGCNISNNKMQKLNYDFWSNNINYLKYEVGIRK